MNAEMPVACSLDAGQLEERLTAIREVGARSLTFHAVEGSRHTLRFRGSRKTRRQLEEIVAAEADCCSFLDLSLHDDGGDLVLSIAAPEHAKELGDQLAHSFESDTASSPHSGISRGGVLLGAGGLALAVCCIAAPVVLGVAVGATLGSVLDAAAVVLVAAGVAVVLRRRRKAKNACC
jgi:hypothetical protein